MTRDTHNTDAVPDVLKRLPLLVFAFVTVVFFITSHDFFRTRGAGTGAEAFITGEERAEELLLQFETGQTYKALTYIAFGALSLLGMLSLQRFRPVGVRGLYGMAAVFFFLWCGLSVTWSFEPMITVNKLAIFVMLSLGAVFTAQRFRMEDLLLFVIFSSVVYLAVGVFAETLWGTFRPWASGYRFSGTIHPNGQGMNCALLFLASLFAAARYPQFRGRLVMLAILALAFLVFTKSRTPFAVSFTCLALYAVLWAPGSAKLFLGTASAVLLLATPIFYPVVGPLIERVIMLGRTETTLDHTTQLSGRTDLWAECWHFIQERLLLGWGYNSFWTLDNTQDIARQIDWYSGSAHSVYLDLWLGVGIFGLLAYLILLLGGMVRFGRLTLQSGDAAHGFAFVLLLFSALHGIFESAFLYPAMYTFLVMLIMARGAFVEEPAVAVDEAEAAAPSGTLAAAR